MTTNNVINITIDNKSYQASLGQNIIEVADSFGIYIPRFCYHPKLSIAANCRMCLVEVEKAPKPLPACATPVMDGMVVFTRSKAALKAQQDIMSFLLINHPLDCPICDQGGECDLQDLAMSYGKSMGDFDQDKRAVIDEDLGALVATEMTRCIHCTRCVRFGEEVAGMPELGVMSRGGKAYIGTYLQRKLRSELSGNVIDLCPVGALTAKPSRFRGRSWSFKQHAQIARHDCIGSNIYCHVHSKNLANQHEVIRVLPRENESINQTWLSDRDRFSYEGMYKNRLSQPKAKIKGQWQDVSWQVAFDMITDKLSAVINNHGANNVAGLISPNATLEESFLMQKWLKSLGVDNFDYRVKHIDNTDFLTKKTSADFNVSLSEIATTDAILLVDAYPRRNQPLLNHRIRNASLNGAKVFSLGYKSQQANYKINLEILTPNSQLVYYLAGLIKAIAIDCKDNELAKPLLSSLEHIEISDELKITAKSLQESKQAIVILGEVAMRHPDASQVYAFANCLVNLCDAKLQIITEGSNTAGLNIISKINNSEKNAQQMLSQAMKAYIVHDISIENDVMNNKLALENLTKASFNVFVSAFDCVLAREWADVILPTVTPYETSGTIVNCVGSWQSFNAAIKPNDTARPAWKIYAALLAWLNEKDDFSYENIDAIRQEINSSFNNIVKAADVPDPVVLPEEVSQTNSLLWGVLEWHDYSVDSLARNADSLQKSIENLTMAKCNSKVAKENSLSDKVKILQNKNSAVFDLIIDNNIADNTILIPAGLDLGQALGFSTGLVKLEAA